MEHNLKFIKLILKNIKSQLLDNDCDKNFDAKQLFKYLERFDIIDDDLIYYRLLLNKCNDIPGITEDDLGKYLDFPGYLILYRLNITSLPDGLTVGGGLNLRETNITSLPDGLTVGGYLYLQGTKIKKIPDDAIIKGKIYK